MFELHNSQWKSAEKTLADQVGLKSVRTMDGFVYILKVSFTSEFLSFLNEFIHNGAVPQTFPVRKVKLKKLEINESGQVLLLKGYEALDFQSLGKKRFCIMCV